MDNDSSRAGDDALLLPDAQAFDRQIRAGEVAYHRPSCILCAIVIVVVPCTLFLASAMRSSATVTWREPHEHGPFEESFLNGLPFPCPPVDRSSESVVVVGGGIAGLYSAYTLLSCGISNITLLERSNRLGGKIWSEYRTPAGLLCDPSTVDVSCDPKHGECECAAVELGAISLYKQSEALVRSLGHNCVREDYAALDFADKQSKHIKHFASWRQMIRSELANGPSSLFIKMLDYVHGEVDLTLLEAKMMAIIVNITGFDGSYQFPPPYRKELWAELGKPCTEWLRDQGLQDVEALFRAATSPFGYGFIEHLPAAYCVAILAQQSAEQEDDSLLPCYVPEGFSRVIDTLAARLVAGSVKIHLNSDVVSIDRHLFDPNAPVLVTAAVQDATNATVPISVSADSLVLAVPLDTGGVASPILKDMTQIESEYMDNYVTWMASSTVVKWSSESRKKHDKGNEIPIVNMYHQKDLHAQLGPCLVNGDVYLAYQYGETPVTDSIAAAVDLELDRKLRDDFKTLEDVDPNGFEVLHRKVWPRYHTHLRGESFSSGLLFRFFEEQGSSKTVHVGQASSFEVTHMIVEQIQQLWKRGKFARLLKY